MRTSIVLWSAASGAVIGLVVDAVLVGVAAILGAVVPALRVESRWVATLVAVLLVAIPAFLTILGVLEGRLKAA